MKFRMKDKRSGILPSTEPIINQIEAGLDFVPSGRKAMPRSSRRSSSNPLPITVEAVLSNKRLAVSGVFTSTNSRFYGQVTTDIVSGLLVNTSRLMRSNALQALFRSSAKRERTFCLSLTFQLRICSPHSRLCAACTATRQSRRRARWGLVLGRAAGPLLSVSLWKLGLLELAHYRKAAGPDAKRR